jgi:hypothetical protein
MADRIKLVTTVTVPTKVTNTYDGQKQPVDFIKLPYFKNGDTVEVLVKINGSAARSIYQYTWNNITDDPDIYGMMAVDCVPKILDVRNNEEG